MKSILIPRRRKVPDAFMLVVLFTVLACGAQGQTRLKPFGPEVTRLTSASCQDCPAHVVIRRDQYGVPHILGDTEEAAAYAHGYVTAEDHGALLARSILRARGDLASEFGAKYADEDVHTRTLRIYDIAAEKFKDQPPYIQAIVNAYAAGYNAYLKHHRAEFPAWATPITGIDVLAHARAVLLLDFALDPKPWSQPPKQGASNMWAIGPSISQSGHAMLLANPHLEWDSRAPLQEVQITVPGVINISGATFVGIPVVTIGFNDSLGWSHTVNRFSADDVYELTLDSSRTKYKYDGRWLPLALQKFVVRVRKGSRVVAEPHTVLWSHYGPIIQVKGEKAYAYRSPNLEVSNFLTQYNQMGKATSITAFTAALNMQQLPMFNIAYADKSGNIWYLFNARIPIRPPGYNWNAPVPGNTSKSEWFTVWPISSLPQLLNPKSGYIQNCNDAPWYVNLEQPINRAPFDSYLKVDGVTWRGMESLTILSAERNMTLEKLMVYKYNSLVVLAERVKDELITNLRAAGDQWKEGADVLQHWDNTTHASSRGAVLFFAWWEDYSRHVQRPFRITLNRADPTHTPAGISDPATALESFGRAVTSVKQKYGALDVAWGDLHRARRGNLDLPLGGSDFTLERTSFHIDKDGREVADGGDAYALAVEFGDSPHAFSVVPYSEASNPKSPYYNNQLQTYADEKFKPVWFSEQDIASHLARQYRPEQ